jgi:hypothetical protein
MAKFRPLVLGRVTDGNGRGNFFQQYHYWPRDLNREARRGRQETERTPVQLENRITGKLTSSYLNTWYLRREPELGDP